jgi:cysteinyl-tRNA synthetase
MTLELYNTLTRKIESFTPMSDKKVTLYTCGPTVYDRLHVGNWTAFIYWDILVRTLIADGYQVERVMNITDVGHLVSDEDEGEDKLEKGARREGKTAWEIAELYSEDFMAGMEKLGLITPEHVVRATDFIPQQLDLVRVLKEKGFTYQIDDGIYFDTSKFPRYADFAGLDLAAQKAGARVEFNQEKRNPSDFALWKFTPVGETRDMEWETPSDLLEASSSPSLQSPPSGHSTGTRAAARGARLALHGDIPPVENVGMARQLSQRVTTSGAAPDSANVIVRESEADSSAGPASTPDIMGFPGWHLECSAMAMSILGPTIDIHTGGIDHIPVHHTNEIAQSESASGQIFSHYWLHNNHLKVEGTKISKSLQNGYTLQDLEKHGFTPLDFRMFVLQGQYSNEGNFTFDNLTAAKNRLIHWCNIAALRHQIHDTLVDDDEKSFDDKSISLVAASGAILEAMNNNLNTPEALRVIDQAFAKLDGKPLKSIHQHGLEQVLATIDELLGLQLIETTPDIDDETKQLILRRQRAREEKNWAESDRIRDELAKRNIIIQDTASGSIWEYAPRS